MHQLIVLMNIYVLTANRAQNQRRISVQVEDAHSTDSEEQIYNKYKSKFNKTR